MINKEKHKMSPLILPLLCLGAILMASHLTGCLSDDRDGDGLPNSIEKEGWSILLIPLGETNKIEINVTSDPGKYDTDGDGLSDWEEFISYHTHPREKDTDGDTLSDYDEIFIYASSPTDAFHDIDKDYFWDGDEVLYFRDQGFDDDAIKTFLNISDCDQDGVPDGRDKDPLQDLRINLTLQSITITHTDDDASPTKWEIYFRIIGDATTDIITDTMECQKGTNHSLNLTFTLDLGDEGEPGKPISLLQLATWDNDTIQDNPVQINNASSFWGTDEFIIPDTTQHYTLTGEDGTLYFTITDASIPIPQKYG